MAYQISMAKKQTRRSISVSHNTYNRLRAYCETNGISMSRFVEMRVGDFLGRLDKTEVVEKEPLSDDPDVKLTADQIFTF